MFEFIKNFFRKRYLTKFESKVETGLLPLSEIKNAVTFIDVEDPSFDACKEQILAFYRENKIKGEIFFFDFRKISNEERLITSINTTVLRKDLDWLGRPSQQKVDLMLENNPDLFISLIAGKSFPIEYMAKCSNARFKIGREQLSGGTFDLVISDPFDKTYSQDEVFKNIKQYLNKIG